MLGIRSELFGISKPANRCAADHKKGDKGLLGGGRKGKEGGKGGEGKKGGEKMEFFLF